MDEVQVADDELEQIIEVAAVQGHKHKLRAQFGRRKSPLKTRLGDAEHTE